MRVRIYSLKGVLYEGEAAEIVARTTTGEISVLAHHEPLVTMLTDSELRVVREGAEALSIPIRGGFLEVRPDNSVVVLAEE